MTVEPKSGLKTTEFWVTMLANVGLVASAFGQVLPGDWAAIAVAISTGAYALSRAYAKANVVEEVPADE